MTRILIIDDHPLFREAMQTAIRTAYADADIIEAASLGEASKQLTANPKFDLVLLDLNIPDTKGFFGLMDLRARYPRLPLVVVSGHEDARIIRDVMSYGALGFIPKSTRKPDLVNAIRQVLSGEIYLPESYSEPAEAEHDAERAEVMEKITSLTPQQMRVLKMLHDGLLNKQIAYELQVGETTVKAHVSEILRKFKVYSRTQVVIELGKLDADDMLDLDKGFTKAAEK